jgi:post-segregation antitoxin (ccd killing protein)
VPNRTIYLPKHLADKVEQLDLNVSKVVQEALSQEIERHTGCCARCGKPLEEKKEGDLSA